MPETGPSGEHALACMQEVKDHLYDRNMPFNCKNVELRGFEPLTSCMPYKPEPWLDVAEAALPAASIAACRWTWPDIAARLLPVLLPHRVSQAPRRRQAPPRKTEPKPRSHCPSGLAGRHGRHTPRRHPGAPNAVLPDPGPGAHRGITHADPVLLHAARHEQPRRPVNAEVRRTHSHGLYEVVAAARVYAQACVIFRHKSCALMP